MLVCYVFLLWSTLWCNIVKYHLHVCSQPIPIPASPDMIQMIRISGALSEKKRTWHQNIWRYLTLLSVGIFYWWLPLSKYWTSINILEMWAGAPAGDIVCTVLATLTPSMTKRAWNEGYSNQLACPLWLLHWRPNFITTYHPSRGLLLVESAYYCFHI